MYVLVQLSEQELTALLEALSIALNEMRRRLDGVGEADLVPLMLSFRARAEAVQARLEDGLGLVGDASAKERRGTVADDGLPF